MHQTYYLKRPLADATPLLPLLDALGLPPDDTMHTTLIYSRTPVDWSLPVFTPEPYGLDCDLHAPRLAAFGPHKNLLVLVFEQPHLEARHRALTRFGARSDWAPYRPHLTLGALPQHWQDVGVDLPTMLRLGPEQRRVI